MNKVIRIISRGNINCANGTYSSGHKPTKASHDIPKGDMICLIWDTLKDGSKKRNLYCEWCYNALNEQKTNQTLRYDSEGFH